ncbi:MAG: AEC family transporter [Lachnospiraceae bacterium]|nr:AEC family transporter [Lachnospiraceae bacterium]
MELAQIAFHQTMVMLIIIFIGVISNKTGVITSETNQRLSDILVKIVNPMVIFVSFQMKFDVKVLKGLAAVFILAFFAHFIGIAVAHFVAKDQVESFSMTYSNCGFMGIPLIRALLGSQGVVYLAAYIAVFNLLAWTHGISLMSGQKSSNLSSVLKQPAIIALILGFAAFLLRIDLPSILLEPIEVVSDMNTPMAMLIAGVTIAQSDLADALKNARNYFLVVCKLFMIPAIFALACFWIPVDNMVYITAVMATACPSAAMGTIFAVRYHRGAEKASQLFTMTTTLSMGTLPVMMTFVGFLRG